MLSSGALEHVAADRLDIDGYLAERLPSIDEIGDASRTRHPADCHSVVDQAAISRQPGQGDETDAPVDHACERIGIDRAVLAAGDHLDPRAGPRRRALHRREVAAPFLAPDQNAVAGAQRRQGGESEPPAGGAAGREGDLRGRCIEKARGIGARLIQPALDRDAGLMRAIKSLALELLGHSGERGGGHQRGAGMIEVDAGRAARRCGAESFDIEAPHYRTCTGWATAGRACPNIHRRSAIIIVEILSLPTMTARLMSDQFETLRAAIDLAHGWSLL
ncbi:hypothetical protein BOSE127_190508 [Bosea sp. 127]|nr:hypothetical protein BOSE127_190508 [Bosea sp. 127]